MEKDQLDGLLALKLVAEKKNFTAAAKELKVSPPAISQMIKQLESRLGVSLLARTTRSTHLTEAGERFLNQAGPALDQILEAVHDVGVYAVKPSGLLRLNVPRIIYPNLLEPIVSSFAKKYPDICVEVFFEDQQSDIVASGFDAGIRLSDILAKDMVAIKLQGPVRFVIAGSPKYFNKMGRPKHPKDLLKHNCLCIRVGHSSLYDRWEFEHKGEAFEVQVKGSLILNDSLVMLESALAGLGLVYTAESAIANKVSSGKLEIVLSPFSATSTGFYLYYPQRSQVLPKLRAFLDHMKSELTQTEK